MTEIDNEIVESVETVQEAETETPEVLIATVGAVSDDGVTLIFPGEDAASEKKYSCNTGALFKAGDRVKIAKESGSYIVEYPIGEPMNRYPLPSGGSKGDLLSRGDSERTGIWLDADTFVTLPSGGSSGKVLGYSASGVTWVDGIPSTGTTGYYLKKTATGTEWDSVLPSTGTTGYFLKKSASGTEWAAAAELPSGGSSGKVLGYGTTGLSWVDGIPTSGSTGQLLQKTLFGVGWTSFPTINGSGTSSIGFFGTTATSRKTVTKASTSATLSTLITTVNNLITALANYGLIQSY